MVIVTTLLTHVAVRVCRNSLVVDNWAVNWLNKLRFSSGREDFTEMNKVVRNNTTAAKLLFILYLNKQT